MAGQKPEVAPADRRLLLLNKPYMVLCQFTDEAGRETLKDYIKEPGIYAAGRLDRDSEGLLLLTNDGKLQARLTQPGEKTPKTYWVQVEGMPDEEKLAALRAAMDAAGIARRIGAVTCDRFRKQPRGLPLGAGGFGGAVRAARCSVPSGAGSATGAGARSGAWLRPPLGAAIDR